MRTIQSLQDFPENHWIKEFQTSLLQQDLSPATKRGYIYDLIQFRRWINEFFTDEPEIGQLTTNDIAAYRHFLTNTKNMKAASVNRLIQSVKRLFTWANDTGLSQTNAAEKVRFMKKAVRYRPHALRKKELYSLLRVAGQSTHGLAARNYALVQLLVQTGIRVQETARLRVEDLGLHQRSGSVRIRDGKGLKEREIPLNAAARRALQTYLEGRNGQGNGHVFNTKRNTPIAVRTLQTAISTLAKKANITRVHVTAHTLRHTFAVNYLKANPGNLVDLATLLGHESLDTVAIYTRPSQTDLAEGLERSPMNVL